ncbi:Uncharacterized protein C24H6.02c [Hypsizygus marmoreus]|uniref:Uncharacterized protein C24H6.02c n=1 Tax=Hypsizygus marmoreus TaxID=39966 RepID=A0A369JYG4_HYPMA|nr:Uncharacterized protein C24H6.02c [Hypsizygus marmoreus]
MLPSRLFRNTGLPPALRSLITPGASLPSTVSVQLRLRLGVLPGTVNPYSTRPSNPPSAEPKSSEPKSSSSSPALTTSQPLPEALEPKLSMTFTCTVKDCGERSTHQFTKRAYQTGIVLIECPGCKNRHLIADHLGWFKDGTKDGKLRTVEDILREKGEKVKRGRIDAGGVVEYTDA